MLLRHVILGGAVLGLTACGGQALLETEHDTYAPGVMVELRLINKSFQYVGFNLCGTQLQHHEGETWTSIPYPPRTYCNRSLSVIGPGMTATHQDSRTNTLEAGEYRFVTTVDWNGEREELTSNPVRVQ